MLTRPPVFTLFPYTTLFRSVSGFSSASAIKVDPDPRGAAPRIRVSASRRTTAPSPKLPLRLPSTSSRGMPSDRKSTRLNSSHTVISYAVFCLKKKNKKIREHKENIYSLSFQIVRLQDDAHDAVHDELLSVLSVDKHITGHTISSVGL